MMGDTIRSWYSGRKGREYPLTFRCAGKEERTAEVISEKLIEEAGTRSRVRAFLVRTAEGDHFEIFAGETVTIRSPITPHAGLLPMRTKKALTFRPIRRILYTIREGGIVRKLLIIIGVGLFVLSGAAHAQLSETIGDIFTTTAPGVGMSFLKIGLGARAVSLGGAYAPLVRDPTAVYWNPAAVVYAEGIDFSFSHLMLMEDIRYEFFALSTGDGKQGVGLGMGGVFYGDMELRDETPSEDPMGMFSAYSFLLKLSYGRSFGRDFAAGASVSGILERIYTYSTNAYGLDVGILYYLPIFSPLTLSLNMSNLGPKIRYLDETFRLPLTGRMGVSYAMQKGSVNLACAGDISKSIDSPLTTGVGVEAAISWFALRGGYRLNDQNVTSWAGGFGVRYRLLSIDYSLSPYSMDLGTKHCFSLNVDL